MNLEESRQILLQHSRSKKNGQFPKNANLEGKLVNPICGDAVHLKIQTQNQHVIEIGFSAKACAICTASSSLLCEELAGKSVEAALGFAESFEMALLESPDSSWPELLLGLRCFEHLRVNPTRKACALLPFTAMRSVLKKHLA